jgi:hypothetical protein
MEETAFESQNAGTLSGAVKMDFRTVGLDPAPFRHLFGLSDAALADHSVKRYIADSKPGFPDRVQIRDLELGEKVLLLNYMHQPASTPYRSCHAIFVSEGAQVPYDKIVEIPEALRVRPISLRAFDDQHQMVDADLVDGRELEGLIVKFLGNAKVQYLHAHFAKRGCYAARIERA